MYEVVYEGKQSNSKTTIDFQITLLITSDGVRVKNLDGFEDIEAESIAGVFQEMSRISKRIVETLEQCTVADINLPLNLFQRR